MSKKKTQTFWVQKIANKSCSVFSGFQFIADIVYTFIFVEESDKECWCDNYWNNPLLLILEFFFSVLLSQLMD